MIPFGDYRAENLSILQLLSKMNGRPMFVKSYNPISQWCVKLVFNLLMCFYRIDIKYVDKPISTGTCH